MTSTASAPPGLGRDHRPRARRAVRRPARAASGAAGHTRPARPRPAARATPPEPSGLEVWGPRLVALSPFIAVALFLLTRQWIFFLLIPAAGVLFGRSAATERPPGAALSRRLREPRPASQAGSGVARGPGTADSPGMETWITELTPLSFLERSADVHPDKVAVVHGPDRWTYRELAQRAGAGGRPARRRRRSRRPVAYLLPNVPEMLVAHFAVPLAGAVLVAINTRPVPRGGPLHLRPLRAAAPGRRRRVRADRRPGGRGAGDGRRIVTVVDPQARPTAAGSPARSTTPTCWPAAATRRCPGRSTTSAPRSRSTTRRAPPGGPRACMYTHRGAYLNAFGGEVHSGLTHDSVYLWTLPMFHCNGWCTTVGASRGRRHPRLPARGARRRDLAADPRARRHPPQRRPDRRHHDPERGPPPARPTAASITTAAAPPSPTRSCAWSGWASRSCTSTGSPRPTARTR